MSRAMGFPGGAAHPPYGDAADGAEPIFEINEPPRAKGGRRRWSVMAKVLVAVMAGLVLGVSAGAAFLYVRDNLSISPASDETAAVCAKVVSRRSGTLGAVPVEAAGAMAKSGSGVFGQQSWAVDVTPTQQNAGVISAVAVVGDTVIVTDWPSNNAYNLIAVEVATGRARWWSTVRYDGQSAERPEIADGYWYFTHVEGQYRYSIGVDLRNGVANRCEKFAPAEARGTIEARWVGSVLYRYGRLPQGGEGTTTRPAIERIGKWTNDSFDVVLGGEGNQLLVGRSMEWTDPTNATIGVVDAGSGETLWSAPMRDVVAGLAAWDNAPVPEWVKGRPAVGVLRPGYAGSRPVEMGAGEVTLTWTPASAGATQSPSAFVVTLGLQDGKRRSGGVVQLGTSMGGARLGADGAVWLPPAGNDKPWQVISDQGPVAVIGTTGKAAGATITGPRLITATAGSQSGTGGSISVSGSQGEFGALGGAAEITANASGLVGVTGPGWWIGTMTVVGPSGQARLVLTRYGLQ